MKKITSVLLSVVMLMSVLCMPTQAKEASDCLAAVATVDEENGTLCVEIVAEEKTTNGKFTLAFDTKYLTLDAEATQVTGDITQVKVESKKLTIGYASSTANAVDAGDTVAIVCFDLVGEWMRADLTVTVLEFNENEKMNSAFIVSAMREITIIAPTPGPAPTPDEGDKAVTETIETEDGTTVTTVTDAEGNLVDVAVTLPETEEGETVTLPVEIEAAEDAKDAVTVEITVPETTEEVTVEIPVEDVTPGTVVIVVNEDGTEEIIRDTAMTEDGVAITVDGSVSIKVVDNSKDFIDDDMWAKDAIEFVTAREIFNGTGDNTFSPNQEMTRAMLMTVLARMAGEDTNGGSTWYEKAMEWAKANGISDGTNPNANITREQLATMLYRYAGEPTTEGDLSGYTDAGDVSAYAENAMKWAVENGLINGMGDGTLNPKGEATRAQLAKILMCFING